MRVGISRVWMTVALAACVYMCASRAAQADEAPASATPRPTLTKEQEAILKKLVLFTDAKPDSGPAPLTVHFSAEPSEVDEPVNPKYVWDFGDGSPKVKGQRATHTYKKPGEYKAILKVTDDVGQAGGDDFSISVEEPATK